jgi:hypothetical protein
MPDGVHARVEPEQPSRRQSALDLARGDAASEELPARHDPALALGERGDDAVRGALSTHVVEEAPGAADSPRSDGEAAGAEAVAELEDLADRHQQADGDVAGGHALVAEDVALPAGEVSGGGGHEAKILQRRS